ncbi:centromere protein U isoform X2 [Melanerpes formicivorus]|uniref:centromere protein U isoform X2 n=1 Tax=Melanerpes formicivorus TaxID=211600 RepID=UPI00358E5B45
MSSKKKTKRSHSGNTLKRHNTNSRPQKLPPLEEPDVSTILMVAEAGQLEELGDSFDHPLHSTAVDAYGEEHSDSESLGRASAPLRKRAERSKKIRRSKIPDGAVQKINTSGTEDTPAKENVVQKKALNTTQVQVKKNRTSENTSDPSVESPLSVQVWCPKELKRSSRDITELDVVLTEFERIAENYRQSIDSSICRKAISDFCSALKDQITDRIMEAQELKNMKKKNAKVIAEIKKKRRQLFQLREDLIGGKMFTVTHPINRVLKALMFFRAEPQLVQLQREYEELQERKSSLRQATELVTDLKELQCNCLDYREENPKAKVVYGTSSLPALLVESRRILGAERHFQKINMKLEEALAVQRGKLSQKP